ncbi:hypothetical protein GUITHDRAFT_140850 [Guillardia theta CCMP2712]|uniref:WW domain-containing protein n=1 Tax=Guillardia theta (strain CCMP2712) TaxID=905079 RepID=L1J3A5_GUITC|nr:hypothetical protein GUITHDRAFT_140850 [Guillardia theta CCMP2712]EKX42996.1 hypothetical protein GUITHDRAFT_140850 [Guillardia theta CCMP2712]|eukprot:XP_005829976.1 hypothetical protein GUITHDRAFT_140850 [Guillardia theta CCMP2712]
MSSQNKRYGIGINFAKNSSDEGFTILALVPGQPASLCGRLYVGDKLLAIDGWLCYQQPIETGSCQLDKKIATWKSAGSFHSQLELSDSSKYSPSPSKAFGLKILSATMMLGAKQQSLRKEGCLSNGKYDMIKSLGLRSLPSYNNPADQIMRASMPEQRAGMESSTSLPVPEIQRSFPPERSGRSAALDRPLANSLPYQVQPRFDISQSGQYPAFGSKVQPDYMPRQTSGMIPEGSSSVQLNNDNMASPISTPRPLLTEELSKMREKIGLDREPVPEGADRQQLEEDAKDSRARKTTTTPVAPARTSKSNVSNLEPSKAAAKVRELADREIEAANEKTTVMARKYGIARSEASRLKDELRTRELEIELLQRELQSRDEELKATGAHTEHIHDTMLRLRAMAEEAGADKDIVQVKEIDRLRNQETSLLKAQKDLQVRSLMQDDINTLSKQAMDKAVKEKNKAEQDAADLYEQEEKASQAELRCGRLEARVLRSEADLAAASTLLKQREEMANLDALSKLDPLEEAVEDSLQALTLSGNKQESHAITPKQAQILLTLFRASKVRGEMLVSCIGQLRALLLDFVDSNEDWLTHIPIDHSDLPSREENISSSNILQDPTADVSTGHEEGLTELGRRVYTSGILSKRAASEGIQLELRRTMQLMHSGEQVCVPTPIVRNLLAQLAQKEILLANKETELQEMSKQCATLSNACDSLQAQIENITGRYEKIAQESNARMSQLSQRWAVNTYHHMMTCHRGAHSLAAVRPQESQSSPPDDKIIESEGFKVLHLRSPDGSPDAKGDDVTSVFSSSQKITEQHEWGLKAWANIQKLNERIMELEMEADRLRLAASMAGTERDEAVRASRAAEQEVKSMAMREMKRTIETQYQEGYDKLSNALFRIEALQSSSIRRESQENVAAAGDGRGSSRDGPASLQQTPLLQPSAVNSQEILGPEASVKSSVPNMRLATASPAVSPRPSTSSEAQQIEKLPAAGEDSSKMLGEEENVPLPEGWTEHVSRSTGKIYYRHKATGQSRWRRPT